MNAAKITEFNKKVNDCRCLINFEDLLDSARQNISNGDFNQGINTYDQLSCLFPQLSIPILAELYEQFKKLPVKDRYSLYQSRFYDFNIKSTDKVLDIGSGNVPFQFATHLADISLADDELGRAGASFKHIDGKSVRECDLENLPFENKEFDFVYCSHVLEHVQDPGKACSELMRIAKRGYIETPKREKDLWLNTANVSKHRWHIDKVGNKLVFNEYAKHQKDGLQNDVLMKMHVDPQTDREKALSALIYLRANVLNTMYMWKKFFEVEVNRAEYNNNDSKIVRFKAVSNILNNPSMAATDEDKIRFYYDKLWEEKLNDQQWLENDGKGRVAECADYLKKSGFLKANNNILDIGCGRGTLGHYIDCIDINLCGIDISINAVAEAVRVYKKADCINLNGENIPYENDFFDIAVSLDVIEHVLDPTLLIREIFRVIKPGGYFILSTPNILYEKHLKYMTNSRRFPKTSCDNFPYDGGHLHFFTYQDIFDLLNNVGFKSQPIGPLSERFDYEFKESMVWVLAGK